MRRSGFEIAVEYLKRRKGVAVTITIDIDSLTVAERLDLIEKLWEGMPDSPEDFPLTPEQAAELDRRVDALEGGQSPLSDWKGAKTRILSRLHDRHYDNSRSSDLV